MACGVGNTRITSCSRLTWVAQDAKIWGIASYEPWDKSLKGVIVNAGDLRIQTEDLNIG